MKELFEKQISLQNKFGNDVKSQKFINETVLAAIVELTECLNETPWKSWKKNQNYNNNKFKEEIIDVWHFVINLSLSAGLTHEDVKKLFMEKNKVNNDRIEENY